MSAYRVNSKRAKGYIETSDSSLIQSKQGEGIGDIFSSVANLVSNHGSKIMTGIETAGKAGLAAKNIFDAKKSYTEMSKAGEELDYIKKTRRAKEAKKRLQEEQQITAQSNKAIQDIVNKALQQQSGESNTQQISA
jgi:hypothetical protein